MEGYSQMLRQLSVVFGITCVALAAGCGDGGGGNYEGPWAQASGVIRLDNNPISEEGTISFVSAEGYTATGAVDGSGNFKLKYNGSNDIPVGTYNVGFLPAMPVQSANNDPASFFNADGSTKVAEKHESKIPAKYHQPGSSGIQIQVSEGANDLKVDLDS
jgi:hypothetical protein